MKIRGQVNTDELATIKRAEKRMRIQVNGSGTGNECTLHHGNNLYIINLHKKEEGREDEDDEEVRKEEEEKQDVIGDGGGGRRLGRSLDCCANGGRYRLRLLPSAPSD